MDGTGDTNQVVLASPVVTTMSNIVSLSNPTFQSGKSISLTITNGVINRINTTDQKISPPVKNVAPLAYIKGGMGNASLRMVTTSQASSVQQAQLKIPNAPIKLQGATTTSNPIRASNIMTLPGHQIPIQAFANSQLVTLPLSAAMQIPNAGKHNLASQSKYIVRGKNPVGATNVSGATSMMVPLHQPIYAPRQPAMLVQNKQQGILMQPAHTLHVLSPASLTQNMVGTLPRPQVQLVTSQGHVRPTAFQTTAPILPNHKAPAPNQLQQIIPVNKNLSQSASLTMTTVGLTSANQTAATQVFVAAIPQTTLTTQSMMHQIKPVDSEVPVTEQISSSNGLPDDKNPVEDIMADVTTTKVDILVDAPADLLPVDIPTCVVETVPVSTVDLKCEETELTADNLTDTLMTDLDQNSNQGGSDFDPATAMNWENGIGTLPGSDFKFRLNEFGCMEMITDDLQISEETKMDENDSEMLSPTVSSFMENVEENKPVISPVDKGLNSGDNIDGDAVCQCENCGTRGIASDFCKSGRFCSLTCVGAFAGKKNNSHRLKPSSRALLDIKAKKKRKKLLDDMSVNSSPETPTEEDIKPKLPIIEPVKAKKSKGFNWADYFATNKCFPALQKIFKEPFPQILKNGFKVGMKLEGIDPKHMCMYCVLTVAEVQGFRVRLHFDGYSECYDFWTNADSPFLFPIGWCEKNGKTLQPPKGYPPTESFNWPNYLRMTKSTAAPKGLFVSQPATSVTPTAFRVGMKLEAVDKRNISLICVATVADTLGDKVLIHFDGWEDNYDYWCDIVSPYIHPVGWCEENGRILSPPFDWKDVENFTWDKYLSHTKSSAVPARAFKPRLPYAFEPDMMIEAVDIRNPILIRVARIVAVEANQIKIHFEGWSDEYDFWEDDDSMDIHPPGWCTRTSHWLQPPLNPVDLVEPSPNQSGCPTPGCKGIGHIKGAKYTGHHSSFGCPYSPMNLNKDTPLLDRLGSTRSEEGSLTPSVNRNKFDLGSNSPEGKCPTPDCDGTGHVTGKFTSHHRLSGCPFSDKNLEKISQEKKPYTGAKRGRKRLKPLNIDERRFKPRFKEEKSPDGNASLYNGIHQSVFQTYSIPNPSRDLPLCWEQHSKLLPGVDQLQSNDISKWTLTDVANFIQTLPGCENHGSKFVEEQIDGEAFLLLNQTDIVKILNIKLGPALKIFNSILMFKNIET
ncbi:hypothetical protein SNE40_004401 [Patella caerulea]